MSSYRAFDPASTYLEIAQSLHCSVTAWSYSFGSLLNENQSPKPAFSECRYGNCVYKVLSEQRRPTIDPALAGAYHQVSNIHNRVFVRYGDGVRQMYRDSGA